MASVSSGAHSSRARRRRELLYILARKAKRKLKLVRRRDRSTRGHASYSDEKRIELFKKWCAEVELELHPKISIRRNGSCAEIGVVADDNIARGECLAVIPRRTLLSCSNTDIADLVSQEKQLMDPSNSSWIPLLIALAGECTKKEHSFWWRYLSLVPNNGDCSPPMLWPDSERVRLLEGTGLVGRVERDMERIEEDFTSLALPFMLKNQQYFSPSVQCLSNYLKLVSLVMSYSFTDSAESDFLSQTMMVPFVDLLNHHSRHHVELKFGKSSLKLMVIRDIKKGEEVMNTYGQLSNVSLMHTYGFTEADNPHDEALVSSADLKSVFLSVASGSPKLISLRRERWEALENSGVLDEEYSVSCSGRPSPQLLEVVRLLHAKDKLYTSLTRNQHGFKVKLSDLKSKETTFFQNLAEHCLRVFPESYEQVLSCTGLQSSMNSKETYAYTLARGQQRCLRELVTRIKGITRES